MWFNKGDQNSLESGLKRPMGNELCRRLHPNDSRNPFSFTVAPQGVMVWGRGTAPAVDRVLSLIVDLRCIFSLSFIPLEPYPARYARHLPHEGKALSVVMLFPHMRVFALTLWGKQFSRIVAFPLGEGGQC